MFYRCFPKCGNYDIQTCPWLRYVCFPPLLTTPWSLKIGRRWDHWSPLPFSVFRAWKCSEPFHNQSINLKLCRPTLRLGDLSRCGVCLLVPNQIKKEITTSIRGKANVHSGLQLSKLQKTQKIVALSRTNYGFSWYFEPWHSFQNRFYPFHCHCLLNRIAANLQPNAPSLNDAANVPSGHGSNAQFF